MPENSADLSTAKPDQSSLESADDLIRVRAYQLYEERGRDDGHELDDWLVAESELLGKKPSASAAADKLSAKAVAA